ncbi:MAG: immune inhibitor A [Actinobacteria bacterium]|nr:immune inhibitor A [Actinomycetota bacterium]
MALVVVLAAALPATALADGGDHGEGNAYGKHKIKNGDQIDVGNDAAARGKLKVAKKDAPTPAQVQTMAAAAATTSELQSPPIGTQRFWPLVDFNSGGAYFAQFTLQSVGDKIEIWVADNLNYPGADCRNDGQRNVVTTPQTEYMVGEFDGNMYPLESQYFSVPPSRDGANASLAPGFVPTGYFDGPGDKVVTLVANIRDENYLSINFPSYVAGYHSSGINTFVDRNVMTIDSFDWVHRTGANPPNEPTTDVCTSKAARPFSYEATFAHEYQHLLEFWASPGESTWVNEGLSDFAMGLLGYSATEKTIDELGWEGHIQTFLGWRLKQTPFNQIPQPNGGPENSLTAWDDQGSLETVADYGATYTFHELLAHRYGSSFMSDLHNEDVNGIPGLQKVLDKYLTGKSAQELFHEWAAMVALDRSLDNGVGLRGKPRQADYQVESLHSAVYWENPQAYSSAGSPPNGSDYVALRDGAGAFLTAGQVKSLEFKGGTTHLLLPVTWQVDANPPSRTGNPALLSPAGDNLNRTILRDVAVPAGAPSLTFETRYGLESLWDYAFVQVSTNNGQTWTSLANGNTTTAHDPDASPAIVAQLPGFTGDADWHTETFDLSAYAGTSVLLAFRNMTDTNTLGNGGAIAAGVWVDNIAINGQSVSDGSSLDGWRSEVSAPAVHGFTVQLVGISSTGSAPSILSQVEVNGSFAASLTGGKLRRLIGDEVDLVGAIVTYDEPTEGITRYAPYELKVNGVLQPGG